MTGGEYRNEVLVALRRLRSLTTEQVAEQAEISRQTLYLAEKGTRASEHILKKLAKFYEVPFKELIRDEPNEKVNLSDIFLSGMSTAS